MKNFIDQIIMKMTLFGFLLITISLSTYLYLFSGLFNHPFDQYSDTELAPKFNWEKLYNVRARESKETIIGKLGDPLLIKKIEIDGNQVECYQYTKEKKGRLFKFKNYNAEVCFDETDTVIGTNLFGY